MLNGITHKPTIVKNDEGKYVIIGSIDHGMEIPQDSIQELIRSLDNIEALMMEAPEMTHAYMHPMSTEILVKAAVGQSPIHYLSGNSLEEDIGEKILKYAPQNLAEIYLPCVYTRNTLQEGQKLSREGMFKFLNINKGRYGFLDVDKSFELYSKVIDYWDKHHLKAKDLDHFSYDFEGFVGDIRDFEFSLPELRTFRRQYAGKVAVCVGDYHVPFVQDVFDGKEIQPPNWETHIDTKMEDKFTPQDADFLKRTYVNIEEALK